MAKAPTNIRFERVSEIKFFPSPSPKRFVNGLVQYCTSLIVVIVVIVIVVAVAFVVVVVVMVFLSILLLL